MGRSAWRLVCGLRESNTEAINRISRSPQPVPGLPCVVDELAHSLKRVTMDEENELGVHCALRVNVFLEGGAQYLFSISHLSVSLKQVGEKSPATSRNHDSSNELDLLWG